MPITDKHKRPTPQTGCCPWPMRPKTDKKSVRQTEAYRKKRYTCVSVRLALGNLKFADFTLRTRAKLYFAKK